MILVNCQRACKKCDDSRPCIRCVKYGVEESCTNSSRKERKRGVRRGPYKASKLAASDSPVSDSSALLSVASSSPLALSASNSAVATAAAAGGAASTGAFSSSPCGGGHYCHQYSSDSADRPVRSSRKRRINYREAVPPHDSPDAPLADHRGEASGYRDETHWSEARPGRRPKETTDPRDRSGRLRAHAPLFNMVLSAMQGELMLSPDQPSILELAAICTEVLDIERNHPEKLVIGSTAAPVTLPEPSPPPSLPATDAMMRSFEEDRRYHNSTPLPAFVPRDVPTPPNPPMATPAKSASSMMMLVHGPPAAAGSSSGQLAAPVPIPAHLQQNYAPYSAYLSPEP